MLWRSIPRYLLKTYSPMLPFRTRIIALLLSLYATSAALAQTGPDVVRADIGFGDRYKVGCWTPLRLGFVGGNQGLTVFAEVRLPDSDGKIVSINSSQFSLPAGGAVEREMLVRVGKLDSPVAVQLLVDRPGKRPNVVAKRTFSTSRPLDSGGIVSGEPATTRLLVEIGQTSLGAAAAVDAEKSSLKWYTQNVIGRVTDFTALPREWLAYEGVDTILLSTSASDAWASLRADDPRIQALTDWVQLGGRIILFSASNSSEVFGQGGPLAGLAPGPLQEVVTVDNLSALQAYVGGNEPLPRRGRFQMGVPKFSSVRGDVELKVGPRKTSLPVVIRTRHGLGQVVFVGLDVDSGALKSWNGRDQLVEKLLAYDNEQQAADTDNYYYSGPSEISASVQARLDAALENSGIKTPPFLAIAGLVLLYILLIGPGDYLLVKYVLKRMEMTWITFPIIVVCTCLAAYWYADYLKGDDLRINQVEVVDVNTATGLSRGTMWTHVFSPSPDRYNLALRAQTPLGQLTEPEDTSVAWLGTVGAGGGMHGEASRSLGLPAYFWSPDRSMLLQTPIEIWSTKTFVSRWKSKSPATLQASLSRTPNKLVEGAVVNPTDVDFYDCKLVYGTWAWRVGDLLAGGKAQIDPSGKVRKLRNVFKDQHNFVATNTSYYEQQQVLQNVSLAGLTEMMMFYDTLGGFKQTNQWHRYQSFLDLSHSLDAETAMLVGQCRQPRSELVRASGGKPPRSMRGDKDTYVVFYRFVLPVTTTDESP